MDSYKVVRNKILTDLEVVVNALIKEGWRPQGGIAVANDERYIEFFQAMVGEP